MSSLANILWGQDGGNSSERCSDWWVILLVEFQRSEKRWWIFAPDCFMSFYSDAFRMARCLQIKMSLFSLHMLSFCHWCCFFVAPCAVLKVFMTDYFPSLSSTCRRWGKDIVSNMTHFIKCDWKTISNINDAMNHLKIWLIMMKKTWYLPKISIS